MKNLNIILLMVFFLAITLQSCTKVENNNIKETPNQNTLIETESKNISNDTQTNNKNNESQLLIENLNINKDDEFGGIFFNMTIDDFNNAGFEYGDSVDIIFSNGYKLQDIPYFNGYYAKTGDPLLIAYPGYGKIKACICNGDDLWKIANLNDSDTGTIQRKENKKYLDTQKLLNLKYTDERNDYKSDEIFANFRNIKISTIKENVLYRGASPINNKHKRSSYVNNLIKNANVNYDIDLSDDEKSIKEHLSKNDFDHKYFDTLYDKGNVKLNKMNMNYKSKEFANKVVEAMIAMSKNPGPYYVHCEEGKDRTGFMCMIIEGLSGATYQEIVDDYMKTYENYYGVNIITNKKQYDKIKSNYIDDMLRYIADYNNSGNDNIELNNLEWKNIVGRFLIENGMSIDDLDNWYKNILNETIE